MGSTKFEGNPGALAGSMMKDKILLCSCFISRSDDGLQRRREDEWVTTDKLVCSATIPCCSFIDINEEHPVSETIA